MINLLHRSHFGLWILQSSFTKIPHRNQSRYINVFTQAVPLFYSENPQMLPIPSSVEKVLAEIKNFPGFVLEQGISAKKEDLLLAHQPEYVERMLSGNLPQDNTNLTLGITWSKELVLESLNQIGCTLSALQAIFSANVPIAGSLHGGFHHAFYDHGYNLNFFNDLAIAAHMGIKEHKLKKILILDMDVEYGDGTASLFVNNPNVVTCSIHSSKSRPKFSIRGDYDIPCDPQANDAQYVFLIRRIIPKILDEVKPELIIFQAGVAGLLESNSRRLMKLTRKGIRDRNSTVFETAITRRIPLLVVCGPGSICVTDNDHENEHENENPNEHQDVRIRRLDVAEAEAVAAHADVYRNALQSLVQFNNRQFYF